MSAWLGAAVRSSVRPVTNEQASGKPVSRHSRSGQKQDIRLQDDDPIASRLLKNRVSPTWAVLHLPARKDFNRRFRVCQSFIQRDHANDAVKLIQHVGMVFRQVAQDGFVGHELREIALGENQVENVLPVGLIG